MRGGRWVSDGWELVIHSVVTVQYWALLVSQICMKCGHIYQGTAYVLYYSLPLYICMHCINAHA